MFSCKVKNAPRECAKAHSLFLSLIHILSISSTIEEISYQNPELGIKGLFFSGMRVGKDMMGTMSNTLILAFAGGSINTLVFIYAYNYEYLQMINMFDIGIEIIQGVASSMGRCV